MTAAAVELSDFDEIEYQEAVQVMNAIGIIRGYEDGTFRPDEVLTRAHAATFIASLLLTPAGFINGHGDGTFTPDACRAPGSPSSL
jgi:hypothetical protein